MKTQTFIDYGNEAGGHTLPNFHYCTWHPQNHVGILADKLQHRTMDTVTDGC